MVADKLRRFRVEYGLGEVVHPSVGFLTSSWLARLARDLGMRGEFLPTRGSVGWRLRRAVGAIRLRRAPAAFGLWVAR
jgi:hypothetical protein